jgi:hypothetical protein
MTVVDEATFEPIEQILRSLPGQVPDVREVAGIGETGRVGDIGLITAAVSRHKREAGKLSSAALGSLRDPALNNLLRFANGALGELLNEPLRFLRRPVEERSVCPRRANRMRQLRMTG